MGRLRSVEHILLFLGGLLLVFYCVAFVDRSVLSSAEVQRWEEQTGRANNNSGPSWMLAVAPDFTLWSEQRIKGYHDSLTAHLSPPLALLRVRKIHLQVAVLEGTDDLTLNRGVGHVEGTAGPVQDGNMAIAGHRDGFFRGLKDVRPGDSIEMETSEGTEFYVIDHITIVDPSNVSVLAPTPGRSLTLVTCYPFYFLGSAPQRYIVHASFVRVARGKAAPINESEIHQPSLGRQPQR